MGKTKRLGQVLAIMAVSLSAGLPGAALGQEPDLRNARRVTTVVRPGTPVAYRRCDRAKVRDCEADAKLDAQLCGPFAHPHDCAGGALAGLRACWAATGCF